MSKQNNQDQAGKMREADRSPQPKSVQNDAPGYGDKKLEGPDRPAT
ncbi:hypothetical protein BAG01nite_25880 [Brevibacillus agri]|uniref:Uncharacterized protein n=1 Tax=Brevibacillus agri TaxID=51101 RepID=A0ABQ0SRJ5_9BACL|nr:MULTISPECIES: hypothetical protein [Brevibacillus]ELK43257.1 hypothetical protein D478_04376 [Brevibacillus agri BAB-2500]EJL43265.1 hypothetical protein PMI08_02810 [Brevibacillus sp. CF112]MBY0054474.1 hypothetical protein [Brevibacillus agri]MCG5250928.1 hypothetical protein [Brevibacillus agri]MDN4092128.1 hypothetical protein [Brevibacillus agri]